MKRIYIAFLLASIPHISMSSQPPDNQPPREERPPSHHSSQSRYSQAQEPQQIHLTIPLNSQTEHLEPLTHEQKDDMVLTALAALSKAIEVFSKTSSLLAHHLGKYAHSSPRPRRHRSQKSNLPQIQQPNGAHQRPLVNFPAPSGPPAHLRQGSSHHHVGVPHAPPELHHYAHPHKGTPYLQHPQIQRGQPYPHLQRQPHHLTQGQPQ